MAHALTPAAALRQLRAGTLDHLYVLLGEDDHEKLELAAEFEEAVEAELRPFNVQRFHGAEASLGAIVDTARTLPMVGARRVVVVTRAERVLEPSREKAGTTRDLDAMAALITEPPRHLVLVLVATKLDERRALIKRLLTRATVVRCGALETVADAQRWIRATGKARGVRITEGAIRLLSERTGPDLRRLRDELERLLLFAADAAEVTEDDVREVAGPMGPHDDWAVATAIERGQLATALRELGLTLESGAVPYVVMGQLAWVARTKVPPAGTTDAMEAVFRTDSALKRSGGDPRVLLERLVVDLCEVAQTSRLGRR